MDPERTEAMKKNEESVIEKLQQLRIDISNEYNESNWYGSVDGWIPAYVREIEWRLDHIVGTMRAFIKTNLDSKGSAHWKHEVHAGRRIAAIYHQEIYLHRQGADIPLLVQHLKESVAAGQW